MTGEKPERAHRNQSKQKKRHGKFTQSIGTVNRSFVIVTNVTKQPERTHGNESRTGSDLEFESDMAGSRFGPGPCVLDRRGATNRVASPDLELGGDNARGERDGDGDGENDGEGGGEGEGTGGIRMRSVRSALMLCATHRIRPLQLAFNAPPKHMGPVTGAHAWLV